MTGATLLRRCGTALLGCLTLAATAAVPPDWALRIAALPTPVCAGDASAVVLLDETSVVVQDDGNAETTRRLALRILADNGTEWAAASVDYVQNHEQVRSAHSWLIRKGDTVRNRALDQWFDLSIDKLGTLYGEQRYRSTTRGDAVPGDVFVAETRVSGPLLIAQIVHSFGWKIPVAEQTLRLTLPPGFQARPFATGGDAPVMLTSADGRTFLWTVRDQPFKRTEPLSPYGERDCLLGIQIEPPATATRFRPAVFKTWSDVARWVATLNSGQCDSSALLHETALRLTKDCATPADKIAALGHYVQKLPYVARNEGLGRGLGYQPHKASQVFGTGYGDCKDKANLLCAMLHEVGIEGYIAVARIGDDWEINPDFPSPAQFDHAIAAIRVDGSVHQPAVVETTQGGAMLFFDATDPYTSPGDLPAELQGTRVHVQDGASDALVDLPRISPATGHVLIRKADLKLGANGTLTGNLSIEGRGQAATHLRARFARSPTEEALRKMTAELLGDAVRTAQFSKVQRQDRAEDPVCGVALELAKPGYTQQLPNGTLVASLDVLGRGMLPTLSAPVRRAPVKLPAMAFQDDISLGLPNGITCEEIPAPLQLVTEFGSYSRSVVVNGQTLTLIRRAELHPQIVPAASYAKLRKFLSDFAKADRTSVLLKKS